MCSQLGSEQEGSVKHAQLLAAGVGPNAVKRRARSGHLHRVHRGVYIVGHRALAARAEEFAALAGMRRAVAHQPPLGRVSVVDPDDSPARGRRHDRGPSVPPEAGRPSPPAAHIDARDVRPMDNLMLTAPARTLADFAAEAEDDELEAALSEARALKLIKDGDVEAALDRAGNRKGVARLRRLLRLENDSGYTQSKAERCMRRLARGAGLPQPLCNRWILGQRVDFVWPQQKLVVQVDGYQLHGHRSAFERDRKKDQILIAAGYRVIRSPGCSTSTSRCGLPR